MPDILPSLGTDEVLIGQGLGTAPRKMTLAALATELGVGDPGGDPGEQTVQSVVVNLTAGNIQTLSTVPVQVVAAPGANKVIVPVAASFQYKPGAAAFDLSGVVDIGTAQVQHLQGDDPGFGGTDPTIQRFAPEPGGGADNADVVNQALIIQCTDDPGGSGNGTARLQVLYYVMDLA